VEEAVATMTGEEQCPCFLWLQW